jgi:hypothetical protein
VGFDLRMPLEIPPEIWQWDEPGLVAPERAESETDMGRKRPDSDLQPPLFDLSVCEREAPGPPGTPTGAAGVSDPSPALSPMEIARRNTIAAALRAA